MAAIEVCVFDAYGTLFDVGAAARRLAQDIDEDPGAGAEERRFAAAWSTAAEHWRRKQLEYSWLRASFGAHRDFWAVTGDGLDWTLDALEIAAGPERDDLRERLMRLYERLDPFPDAVSALEALRARGRRLAILSNGAPAMLEAATRSAKIDALLEATLSAEEAGVFKPDPRVYDLVETRFGVARGATLFISSNGWDVCCAAAYGFRTVWVNRRGEPMDRLPGAPDRVVKDLLGLPDIAAEMEK